jgi:hypothetical protein
MPAGPRDSRIAKEAIRKSGMLEISFGMGMMFS